MLIRKTSHAVIYICECNYCAFVLSDVCFAWRYAKLFLFVIYRNFRGGTNMAMHLEVNKAVLK